VAAVLDEKMAQPGAYQIRGNRSKRNKFYDALLGSSVMLGEHDSIRSYANEINEKIKKIIDSRLVNRRVNSVKNCQANNRIQGVNLHHK